MTLILTPQQAAARRAGVSQLDDVITGLEAAGAENRRLHAELEGLQVYLAALVYVRGGSVRLRRDLLEQIQASAVNVKIGRDETHAHLAVTITRREG
jgi:hypothetical protein